MNQCKIRIHKLPHSSCLAHGCCSVRQSKSYRYHARKQVATRYNRFITFTSFASSCKFASTRLTPGRVTNTSLRGKHSSLGRTTLKRVAFGMSVIFILHNLFKNSRLAKIALCEIDVVSSAHEYNILKRMYASLCIGYFMMIFQLSCFATMMAFLTCKRTASTITLIHITFDSMRDRSRR